MGVVGVVFALFTVGYILGVWTTCLVFRQPRRADDEAVPALTTTRVITLGRASRLSESRL
jgi:hypothetical protein